MQVKNQNRMANSVDPDETAHQDLHCLHRHLVWSVLLNGLTIRQSFWVILSSPKEKEKGDRRARKGVRVRECV